MHDVRGAADIMADGTQGSVVCDAVSIGLGFELAEAGLANVVPVTPRPDPCPP